MYRIICESYKNFVNSFKNNSYRLSVAEPISLMTDMEKYNKEKKKQSELYKKMEDLVFFITDNIEKFPRLKALIWTLSSREIKGKRHNIAKQEELDEQVKLINSFLKLAYWY